MSHSSDEDYDRRDRWRRERQSPSRDREPSPRDRAPAKRDYDRGPPRERDIRDVRDSGREPMPRPDFRRNDRGERRKRDSDDEGDRGREDDRERSPRAKRLARDDRDIRGPRDRPYGDRGGRYQGGDRRYPPRTLDPAVRRENAEKQLKAFFDQHKTEDWFCDKYHPDLIQKAWDQLHSGARQRAEDLNSKIDAGQYEAPSLLLPSHMTSAPIPTSTQPSTTTDADKPSTSTAAEDNNDDGEITEGAAPKPEKSNNGDDEEGALDAEETAAALAEEAAKSPEEISTTVFLRSVAANWSRQDILDVLTEVAPVQNLVFSEPKPLQGFTRLGWANFASQSDAKAVVEQCNGKKIKDGELRLVANRVQQRHQTVPPASSALDVLAAHAVLARQTVTTLDERANIGDNKLVVESEIIKLPVERQLDLCAAWLRTVHCFCFYCAEQYQNALEVERRCGAAHYRLPALPFGSMDLDGDRWVQSHKHRLLGRMSRLPPNPEQATAAKANMVQAVTKDELIEKLAEDRCKCKVCSKLFKGPDFVMKHISSKHEDDEQVKAIEGKAVERLMWENYKSDPQHVTFVPGMNYLSSERQGGYNNDSPQQDRGGEYRHREDRGGDRGGYRDRPFHHREQQGGGYGARGGYRNNNRMQHFTPAPNAGNFPADPRGLRDYRDLDAMTDTMPHVDFRAPDYSAPPPQRS